MRIFVCDNCGHRVEWKKGITGHEFEYQGFKTLEPVFRVPGIIDLCGPCMLGAEKN